MSGIADIPGNFLDTDLSAFDDVSLTAEDLDWLADDVNRDVPSNGYGADGWPEHRCTVCGARAELLIQHIGGAGCCTFALCTVDSSHKAQRLA